MVKDFRGKARPQALPPAASVGGRRAHRADALQRGALGSPRQCPCPALEEAMELRVVLLLPLCFPGLQAQAPGELSQSEGSKLSVLCPYLAEDEYRELKSWCRWTGPGCQLQVAISGTRTQTYTERARQGYITIQGDPIHRNFSITMTDLRVEDSGTYYCAYTQNFVPLKWISLNVFKEIHKLELDSLSVQCPYHDLGFRSERKAWCRAVGRTGRFEVVERTITITMEKLQAQDSGVYWCALYTPYTSIPLTRIMEVRLSVAKRPAATTLSVTTGTSENHPPGNSTLAGQGVSTYIIISAVLYLLLMPVVIILIIPCIRHHRKLKRRGNRQAEDIYDKPEDTTQLESTERMEIPKDDSKDLKYVTLDFKSQCRPEEPLYCNVEPDQDPKNPKDENVEYAIIACS
uniref:Ig-like domain-containing protein n=1 Tax=Cairina moschata TaxID=8855 RepID=A0A8C3C2S8_CAIMO